MLTEPTSVKHHQVHSLVTADTIWGLSTLSERLKEAMKLRGVRTNQLDRLCGFVQTDKEGRPKQYGAGYTSSLATGRRKTPDADKVAVMAEKLGVRFEWLYWGRGARDLGDGEEPPTAFEAAARESLIDPSDPVEVAIAFTRRLVSQDAIDKFRASKPDHSKSPEELRLMLLEVNRELVQAAIREANDERARAEAEREAEAIKVEPKPKSKRKAS